MNHAELVMRRRNVSAFIKADPVWIELLRHDPPTKSPAGGKIVDPNPLYQDPQEARIVLNKRRFNAGLVNSEAGEIPHTDYLLIGMHTLDVEVNDSFKWLGENYKVEGIYGARTESMLCTIQLLGKDNV